MRFVHDVASLRTTVTTLADFVINVVHEIPH